MVQFIQNLLNNNYLTAALTLFLVLYGAMARPQLPMFMMYLFDNVLFRLLVLFSIVYLSNRNIQVSLIVAVAFVITMGLLNQQHMMEGFYAGMYEDMDMTNE